MKKRSGKNLIRFFYHLLVVLVMAMPMLSGLVRVIYVQSNNNAFESYYGDTINQREFVFNQSTNIDLNTIYYLNSQSANWSTDYRGYLLIDNFVIYDITNDETIINNLTSHTIGRIQLTSYSNNTLLGALFQYLDNGSWVDAQNMRFDLAYINCHFNVLRFSNDAILYTQILKTYDYSYLDNVFDYSIWKTMQDFTFHSDFRFTDIANGMLMTFDNNNLYIRYINFYINWVLTCAVISFAPYVLLTFYHLAIGLLDKFMKKGDDL